MGEHSLGWDGREEKFGDKYKYKIVGSWKVVDLL